MAAAHQTTHLVTVNLFFYLVVSSSSANNVNGGGFSVELIRRNSPNSPFYNHNTSRPKSLSNRFRHLLEPSNPNIPQSEVRRDFDGEHLMKFSIGTPPVDIYGVADTGSTLIWTQCEPCIDCYKQKNPKFDPRKSSTYRNVSCGAQECNLLIDSGPNSCSSSSDHRQELCNYNYSYVDGATTIGLLAKETITLKAASGKPIPLQNIVFGCGHNNTGETFQENQMGVVGLGIGNMSFISQISPAVGGKKFSYCLVPSHANPTSTSKMSFGNGSEVLGEGVVSTRLISELDNNAYRVTLEGMSVGDKFVPFNSSGNGASPGNTILDSGTPNTYLPQQFYDPLVAELKKQIAMSPSEIMDPTFGTLVCYNNKNIFKGKKITVHFEGGAKLQLTPNQIFFYHQEFQNFCFAMQNSSYVTRDDFIVYGNYVQSNFWIGFDLERMVVSFKPTDCTNSSSSVIATPFSLSSTYVLNFLLFVILTF
ncbi:aspartic proteinase CDR1-like [Malus sylvestris]|uniref:aspartic proteinase CDR1-like n=1 Tax=Malus sylvestris TaxID=3752 RepID=UPI0021AC448A|nr:aspartic proteinase CDR1-like [Malus sylvestris]